MSKKGEGVDFKKRERTNKNEEKKIHSPLPKK